MVDLDKKEYVYLMIARAQDKIGNIVNVNVRTFKTERDIKNTMLNIINNNSRDHKYSIAAIDYKNKAIINTNIVASARIEFKSGATKTYEAICICTEEVK